jgi:hypothetical protein
MKLYGSEWNYMVVNEILGLLMKIYDSEWNSMTVNEILW